MHQKETFPVPTRVLRTNLQSRGVRFRHTAFAQDHPTSKDDDEFHLAAKTFRQPKTPFSNVSNGVLVRVLEVDCGSQQYIRSVLRLSELAL